MDLFKPTGVVQNEAVVSLQVKFLEEVVNPVLGVALAVTFALFIYGGARYLLLKETNPEESKKGKMHFIYGGVGLFIVASVWGIIGALASATGSSLWFVK